MASNESGSAEEKRMPDERLTVLDDIVLMSWAERQKANVQIGRALNEQKALLGHGKFQRHFEEKFASMFTFRSAERYMRKAKKADATAKSDRLSELKTASDEGARAIREAAEDDKAEVESAIEHSEQKQNAKSVYRLPLRMTTNDIESTETLRKLPDWRKAERKIVHLLRDLFSKYGVATDESGSHE